MVRRVVGRRRTVVAEVEPDEYYGTAEPDKPAWLRPELDMEDWLRPVRGKQV